MTSAGCLSDQVLESHPRGALQEEGPRTLGSHSGGSSPSIKTACVVTHAELLLSLDVAHTVGSLMELSRYSCPYLMQAKSDCSVVGPDNLMSSQLCFPM